MGNIIVGLVVLAIVGLAVRSVVKSRKKGGCSSCPGGCSCSGKDSSHSCHGSQPQ